MEWCSYHITSGSGVGETLDCFFHSRCLLVSVENNTLVMDITLTACVVNIFTRVYNDINVVICLPSISLLGFILMIESSTLRLKDKLTISKNNFC